MIAPRRPRWIEQTNPLRWLTPARGAAMLEALDRGWLTEVMYAFAKIEESDPDLIALLERCLPPLKAMDWDIRESDGADPAAVEQLDAAYDRLDNLPEAIEHLGLAKFRGFSVCQLQDESGRPAAPGVATRIECFDHWNFVRNGRACDLKWNPEARAVAFESLPNSALLDPLRDHLIVRFRPRMVDRVALVKWIRSTFARKSWADFIETCARQGVVIIEPPNVSPEDRDLYRQAADAFSEGNSVSVPNGGDAKFANGQRGVAPFEAQLRYLREELVMAGTAGMLTMISQPTGIGGGATSSHDEALATIAASEAADISSCFQRFFDRPLLQGCPGCYFQLSAKKSIAPGAILADAVLAHNAGMAMDATQASEKTGYTLTAAPAAPSAGPLQPSAAPNAGAAMNRAKPGWQKSQDALISLGESARRRIAAAKIETFRPLAQALQVLHDLPDTLTDEQRAAAVRKFLDQDLPAIFQAMGAQEGEQKAWLAVLAGAFAGGLSAPGGAK